MGKLTDRTARAVGPGRHGDGEGLALVVSDTGSRKWVLRFQMGGKRRDMGLGPYPEISLSTARAAAAAARALAAQGIDPLEQRERDRKAARPVPTFREIAQKVIVEAQAKSTNAKVRYQWAQHLGPAYSGPLLDRPVNEITTLEVVGVLRAVWREKPEVARKLYPAIRRVFEYARIQLRDEHGIVFANPALWADLKAMGFEAPRRLSRGRHPSLPYQQMPAFMKALRSRGAIAARLLEFLILTNVRTGAALAATFDQFDLDTAIWSIPVINLKDRAHRTDAFRVPLSARAIEIVRWMKTAQISRIVFPNAAGEPMSDVAMNCLLKRMNIGGAKWIDPSDGRPIVPHGFRATFKTWAEETAHFPHSVVEEAMGHLVGTAVERAYRRTDVLQQRRGLMEQWAAHCDPAASDNVVAFKKSGASV